MKELMDITVGSKVAQVKQVKETKTTSASEESEGKDFLSLMFSKLQGNSKVTQTDTIEIKTTLSDDSTLLDIKAPQKSLDEHLLTEVLEVISLLKNETPTTSFPKYSAKIESMLSNTEALEELKDVKNIADLMQLSKKYDLGLEKLSIQKVDYNAIKEEFPNLEKQGFFEVPQESEESVKNTFLDSSKKTEIIKSSEIPFNAIEKPTKNTEKEQSLFEKIITKENTTDEKESKKVVQDTLKTEVKEEIKELKSEVKTSQTELKDTQKEIKTEVKHVETKVESKPLQTEIKEESKNVSQNLKESAKEVEKVAVIETKKEEKTIQTKATAQENIEDVELAESPKATRTSEIKLEENTEKRELGDRVLQNLKTEKSEIKAPSSEPVTTTLQSEQTNNENNNTGEVTTDNIETATIKTENKIASKQEISTKQPTATKETFESFANDLKEKIEQYKPPIMKVQMSLNPKSLGEVDVTIVNRGTNLHVSITSNSNTTSLFVQNQAEFKNSLVNMGFTNLEMNFSDQRESNKEQGKKSSSSNSFFNEENEEIKEDSIELIVPQYV